MSFAINANIFRSICVLRNSPMLKASVKNPSKNSTNLSILLIMIIVFILIVISLCMALIHKNRKIKCISEELKTENLYNKTLTSLNDNLRCFKHDFNNIIQSIGGYIDLNDMDGLAQYYRKLFLDCKSTDSLLTLNPDIINNPSIYSILTNKYYLALDKGIHITISTSSDLANINFDIYKLTRILGILLDNAIEAAQCTKEKEVAIDITSDSKKQLFIISNSCISNDISVEKIFEKGYSTKKNNSGLGLWEVHNILEKNEQANLHTTIRENTFIQQLEIYYT